MKLTNIRKVISHDGPVCHQTIYAPSFLQIEQPPIPAAHQVCITQGDTIFKPSFPRADPNFPLTDPNKGADRLRLWIRRPAGQWQQHRTNYWPYQNTNVVIANHMTFPWMNSESGLRANPETFLGATGSPSLYQKDGQYYCWFVSTVADFYVTTSRQFTVFLATSKDLVAWKLVNFGNDHPNLAVQHAALWFGDFTPATKYPTASGISSVCALPPLDDGLFLYLMIQSQLPTNNKNGLVRQSIKTGVFEIWKKKGQWETIINGQLPEWYTTSEWWVGNPYHWIIDQVLDAPLPFQVAGRYMCLTAPGNTEINVAFSDNLEEWSEHERLELPGPIIVRDVRYFDGRIFFSTNDAGVLGNDPAKYGTIDCTDPYHGLVICEADIDFG